MKRTLILSVMAMLTLGTAMAQLPQIKNRTLYVDGKPFVMYAGELHNSTASSASYMRQQHVFDRLKQMNLNSVLATASWEIVEPKEGQYDFALVDTLIHNARQHDMKLCLLWFGFNKNPFNTYAPSWVKRNPDRFPRVRNEKGEDLQLPSVFSSNLLKAESKAFTALMRHIKEVDGERHTVVMIQVENEPGIRFTPRDYSEGANKAWGSQVPVQLISYLKQNRTTLMPHLKQAWESNGRKTTGTWEQVFGKSIRQGDPTKTFLNLTEGLFTAYSYAQYINSLIASGKREYDLPMFINASVFGFNMKGISLGNGCSIDDYFDMYKAGGSLIDAFTPNSYHPQLDNIVKVFGWKGNPLIIPESSLSAARALYAIGEHAICFSPFGIDAYQNEADPNEQTLLSEAYKTIEDMGSLITSHEGNNPDMKGVYLYPGHEKQIIEMGDYELTFGRIKTFDIGALMAPAAGEDSVATKKKEDKFQGGAIVVRDGDTFYISGYGFNADIKLRKDVKSRYCDYDEIREGQFENGKFVEGRILNGDERNVMVNGNAVGSLRVKMYHY